MSCLNIEAHKAIHIVKIHISVPSIYNFLADHLSLTVYDFRTAKDLRHSFLTLDMIFAKFWQRLQYSFSFVRKKSFRNIITNSRVLLEKIWVFLWVFRTFWQIIGSINYVVSPSAHSHYLVCSMVYWLQFINYFNLHLLHLILLLFPTLCFSFCVSLFYSIWC